MGNSLEVAGSAAVQKNPSAAPSNRVATSSWTLVEASALGLLLLGLYHSILYRLVVQWAVDPNFSHGFFVPTFAAYVIWQDRNRLKRIIPAPSWTGIPIIIVGLLMLLLGVLGVELFTSRASLVILLAGLVVLFRGWAFFRAVLFPWAFLFLMIPWPQIILQELTFPLQVFASKLSAWCLQLVGIPVLREGNVIVLPAITLEVAEACSGIRSLLSLVTLAIIYGYLMENRRWVRVLLAFSAVPIAIVANVFRIFGTGLLAQLWDPDKAMGFFHEFQGWLVFVVSLFLFFAVHRVINVIWKPSAYKIPASRAFGEDTIAESRSDRSRPVRFAIAVSLMLVALCLIQAHSQEEVFLPRQPLTAIPAQFEGWTSSNIPLDNETLEVLGPGEFMVRDYRNASQPAPVNLFIAYFPTQKMGDTIHSPNHCLPGAGWVPTQREVVTLKGSNGEAFSANRYVIAKADERWLVLFWFQAHGRAVADQYLSKYYLIADSIRMHRSDGALIRFMTPMLPNETPNAAQTRIMQLATPLLPLFESSIPR